GQFGPECLVSLPRNGVVNLTRNHWSHSAGIRWSISAVYPFSKGMRQKVGIAIAVAKNAEVILMDEPTSGLDPKATNEFTTIVKQLGQQGKSILMATHDIFNAVNIGTHIGIMRQGELVHTLKASEINAGDLQKLYLETI
ncbi:AAA family ATPase, partial [Mucilaginibacter gilvus]